jgi:hypothetical protein
MRNLFLLSLLLLLARCTSKDKTVEEKSTFQQLKCYFFFISDCPASRNNLPKIQYLSKKYANQVDFVGLVSDPYLDSIELGSTLEELSISFPIQLDTTLIIARKHGAKITPEVFLYADNKLIYSGSVDNYFYALGKHRKVITQHHLADAIKNTFSRKIVHPKHTKSFGCSINFNTKN